MRKISLILVVIISALLFPACSCKGCSSCDKKTDRTFYDINVTFDEENMLITGAVKIDFYNNFDTAVNALKFNLFGNAFREDAVYKPIALSQQKKAYPNGLSYGNMSVTAVLDSDDELAYSIVGDDENVLLVELDDTVYPEERTFVEIYYSLKLANVLARTGYNDNTVNLGNFYPILCTHNESGFTECLYYSFGDPFVSDVADYKVTVTTPNTFSVVSSGSLVKSNSDGNQITNVYTLLNARDFALVLSDKYESVSSNVDGTEINYYYHSDKDARASLATAEKALKTFNNLFGKYPYKTLSICETGFNEGGMEYPCLVMISDDITEHRTFEEVIIHEIAHQWWYGLVGNNEIECGFLDEGLTEYSVVLFYENNPEYGLTRENLIDISHKTYTTYCTVYDKLFGNKNTTMTRSLADFTTSYEYVNIAYVKGALMFDYLRMGVGDEVFYNGLKTYLADNSYKIATPDSLVGAFEKVGANTNGFFKSWFNGEVVI